MGDLTDEQGQGDAVVGFPVLQGASGSSSLRWTSNGGPARVAGACPRRSPRCRWCGRWSRTTCTGCVRSPVAERGSCGAGGEPFPAPRSRRASRRAAAGSSATGSPGPAAPALTGAGGRGVPPRSPARLRSPRRGGRGTPLTALPQLTRRVFVGLRGRLVDAARTGVVLDEGTRPWPSAGDCSALGGRPTATTPVVPARRCARRPGQRCRNSRTAVPALVLRTALSSAMARASHSPRPFSPSGSGTV